MRSSVREPAAGRARVCRRSHRRRRRRRGRTISDADRSADSLRAAARLRVADVDVEGQSAAGAEERLDALGLVRRRSDVAPAARTTSRDGDRHRRRLGAVRATAEEVLPALPHDLQRRRGRRHDAGGVDRLRDGQRHACARIGRRVDEAARRGDRDVLRHQHGARRAGDCARHAPVRLDGLAR